MPQYDGKEVLTIGKADAAKRVAEEWSTQNHYDAPLMFKPGHDGSRWVLVMSGAEEWALEISNDDSVTWPAGVYVEAVNGCTLSLYPST